ncbi:MAG: hypothetical protein M3Q58_00020 [Bacteroidota bacterium]|nr:hypothetical protein [Bacteroidota bacterium]
MLVSWIEIPAIDFHRAVKFYSKVFRIDFTMEEFHNLPHAIFPANESPGVNGAIVETKMDQVLGNGPVLFFSTFDMPSTLDLIENNGGKVLQHKTLIKNTTKEGEVTIPKTLIDGNVGYFAYFKDSEGNKMGLYSNS